MKTHGLGRGEGGASAKGIQINATRLSLPREEAFPKALLMKTHVTKIHI